MEDKTLIIMGNGPSLKDVDFEIVKKHDSFGLNAAYRKYDEINFYPTYFGCFDLVVTDSHKTQFQNLINNSTIKKFFFIRKYFTGEKFQHCNLISGNFITHPISNNFNEFFDNGNSGVNACQVGIILGYTKIILLGVDQNYVEIVEGAKKKDGGLIMEKTPDKNPNYWFDDYQREGDKYNVPQLNRYQKPAWESFAIKAKNKGIDIVNCSPISTLQNFRKSKLEDEI